MKYRSLRWPCDHPVEVTCSGHSHRALLRNVADRGAMVVAVTGIAAGDRVVLSLPTGRVGAEVRWIAGDRCGVRFDRTLTAVELSATRRQVGRLPTAQRVAWGQGLREMH